MSRLAPLLTSKKHDYGTPRELYDELDAEFHFTIDLAAHEENHKHPRYFSPRDNALAQSWEGVTGFLNPPFGKGIGGWLAKARDAAMYERAIICQVLPARVGTRWWRQFILNTDGVAGKLRASYWSPEREVLWLKWEGLVTGVHFTPKRLDFEGANDAGESAPFDTAIAWHASPNRAVPFAKPGDLLWRWPR